MTSPSLERVKMPIVQSYTPTVLECVQMRNWQKAVDVIAADRKTVYEQNRHTNGRMIGNHLHDNHDGYSSTTGHLAIHELCKIATSPTSIRFSKDEISDDEGEDDDEGSNDTEEELDQIFDACELEEGNKMYEVTRFMIEASHSIGPVTVATPPDDDENDETNDTNNGPIEEGAERSGSNVEETTRSGIAIHKSILTYTDSMGKTPLHVLCENSCDTSMMRVILECTREATGNPQAPSALSLILAKDSRGATPLHYMAYSRQCPFSSLKLMMEYCKPRNEDNSWIDPTLCTDSDGETPLHWALAGYVSSRRIRELTRHSVDAIMAENHKGETPFDQFTTNFVDSDWTDHDVCGQEMWENIQEYLKCIKDNHGDHSDSEWLPLHFLAGSKYDFPPIFTDLALKYCGEDLKKPDANAMLPLHLACASHKISSSDTLAMAILKKFQRASAIPAGTTKRLALHFAVETQQPLSLIAALVRTYPRSLNIPDPVTRLWPYVLAGVRHDDENRENESLSVSFSLLRADPSVLHLVKKNESISNLTDKEKARFKPIRNDEEEELYAEQSSRRIRRLNQY